MSSARPLSALIALVVALSSAFAVVAEASWDGAAHGSAGAQADSLDAVEQPTASASNRSVTVDWSAPSSGAPAAGFVVKRYDGSGNPQAVGAGCRDTIAETECTETNVPPGTWRYRITPVNANWRGPESPASEPVTVAAPALSLNRSSVASLPATITGADHELLARANGDPAARRPERPDAQRRHHAEPGSRERHGGRNRDGPGRDRGGPAHDPRGRRRGRQRERTAGGARAAGAGHDRLGPPRRLSGRRRGQRVGPGRVRRRTGAR